MADFVRRVSKVLSAKLSLFRAEPIVRETLGFQVRSAFRAGQSDRRPWSPHKHKRRLSYIYVSKPLRLMSFNTARGPRPWSECDKAEFIRDRAKAQMQKDRI